MCYLYIYVYFYIYVIVHICIYIYIYIYMYMDVHMHGLWRQVAEGNGPVNALGKCLVKALLPLFPSLEFVELSDYKVHPPHAHLGV